VGCLVASAQAKYYQYHNQYYKLQLNHNPALTLTGVRITEHDHRKVTQITSNEHAEESLPALGLIQ
jgi:hypothetical protein